MKNVVKDHKIHLARATRKMSTMAVDKFGSVCGSQYGSTIDVSRMDSRMAYGLDSRMDVFSILDGQLDSPYRDSRFMLNKAPPKTYADEFSRNSWVQKGPS